MGFIIFIFIFIVLILFIWIVLAVLGLFFGGKDPYEEDLKRMDFEDELFDRLDRMKHDKHINIDARQLHLHNHKHYKDED